MVITDIEKDRMARYYNAYILQNIYIKFFLVAIFSNVSYGIIQKSFKNKTT